VPENPLNSDRGSPSLATVGEFGVIDRLTAAREQPAAILLGPGDDAALLAAPSGRVLVTTDMLVQDVHFRMDWSAPEQVGRKAAAANCSDIAAMGGRTTALVVGLGCPPETPAATLDGITEGLWAEARRTGAGVAGGDLVRAEKLVLSITALGAADGPAPITRSGARAGDVLAVCGRLGASAAGFAVLSRGFRSPAAVVAAHLAPEPPYEQGPIALGAGATAMIDVSDGLLADLGHVAAASGVAIDVETERIEIPPRMSEVAFALGADPLSWALSGGEDQALVASFPDDAAVPEGWRVIGTVAEGAGVTVDGAAYDGDAGWRHFAS
jgi:thiamine-monophosphate kinase